MTILYKICFREERDDEWSPPNRPIVNNITDIVTTCLISLLKQMTKKDNIVFFLDGDDADNIIERLCNEFNINYKILQFDHKCPVKINNECTLYIINNVTNENDLIYLCEDDYLHYNNCLIYIKDFLSQYPNYFCHPVDYPNLYKPDNYNPTDIILSESFPIGVRKWHWRSINSTTYTIAFTKKMFDKNYSIFTNINQTAFYDHIINLMYVSDKCYSPVPSLATHVEEDCLSPCIDNNKIFQNNLEEFRSLGIKVD